MRNPLDVLRARLDGAIQRRVEAAVARQVDASCAALEERSNHHIAELRVQIDAILQGS